MHQHIDENGMQELINSLEKLAVSNPQEQFSLVDNLVLDNNDFLPPVALTELPIVRCVCLLYLYWIARSVLNCSF